VVQLVSTLGSAVISARAELGSIIVSALPVATVLTHQPRGCMEFPSSIVGFFTVKTRFPWHGRDRG
jgi:hypothetical protein